MSLISVAELKELLSSEPRLVVLDARFHLMGPSGLQDYLDGHIAGARWIEVETALAGPAGEGGRHPLPTRENFTSAMRQAGVSQDSRVVAYDGGTLLGAARLWWLLRDYGLDRVSVLEGGYPAWLAAEGAIETGAPPMAAVGDFAGDPGHLPQVDPAQIVAGEVSVIDVRAPERFAGITEPIDPVAGHIPGARNLPATEIWHQGRIADPQRARELIAEIPVGAAISCGSGLTACQLILAMEVLGRNDAALYPGSWSGWITNPDRPVATGAD